MTAPLVQQNPPVKDAAVRKRRRRAPAGGASDDCFTCTKRNVKCDRRRPYCTQCLDVGNECSGYKTQLTWGVGVASRGKLRGLSLPIAKAPPVTREPKKSPARARAQTTTVAPPAPAPQWTEHDEYRQAPSCQPIDIPAVTAASAPTTPFGAAGYDYLSISHPEAGHHHMPQNSWGSVSSLSAGALVHSPDVTPKYTRFPFPLVTDNLSSSVGSVGSVGSDVDYLSPVSQSYPREEIPFMHSPSIMYDSFPASHGSPAAHSPPSGPNIDYTRGPTSCPSLVYAPSEASSSLHSNLDVFESHLSQKLMLECDNLNAPEPTTALNNNCETTGANWNGQQQSLPPQQQPLQRQQQHPDETPKTSHALASPVSEHSPAAWPTMQASQQPVQISQELVARMPFFMDYYSHTLCPAMVFIDGPDNPFRDHILQLASGSQSLQHAICALAACNLRMRRKLSLGQTTRELFENVVADKQAAENMGETPHADQAAAEEYQHRNLAVHLLNQQLNEPTKSYHDSVLATLLLLCHYRMVESGVAKFNTQFAGVKKLLTLRRSQQYTPLAEPGWIESMFTYFDTISASINDREAQLAMLPGMAAEMPPLHAGAENLMGCERELFKSISKLGRLNLLFQERPVQSPATTPHAGNRFDGNGFGSTLNEDEILTSAMEDNHRTMFWREWKEVRVALQSWQFDAVKVAACLPGSTSQAQLSHLGSLSEAFRYAALLYTERLANPDIVSSHHSLQNLVTQVVYYATSVESGSAAEKFLLWPLFVAGSECVNEHQQNIVRSKCRDIMARSGYMNNLAALDVLERLWAGELRDSEVRSAGVRPSPLRWAGSLGGPGNELEWIMF